MVARWQESRTDLQRVLEFEVNLGIRYLQSLTASWADD